MDGQEPRDGRPPVNFFPGDEPPPGLFSGADYVDPELDELLALPTPAVDGGIFDEVLDGLENPPGEVAGEDPGSRYIEEFMTRSEGERSPDELLGDAGPETDFAPEDLESPVWDTSDGAFAPDSGGNIGRAALAAGAAVLAGAALLQRKTAAETPAAAPEWFYAWQQQQYGPVPEAQLRRLLQNGELTDAVLVWREGLTAWITAVEAGLSAPLAAMTPEDIARTSPGWHYSLQGQVFGPVSEQELQELAAQGTVSGATLVWREGLPEWLTIQAASLVPAAPPAQTKTAPPVAVPSTAAAPAVEWFYVDGQQQSRGPVSQTEIAALVAAGTLHATTLVWKEGLPEWQSLVSAGLAAAVPAHTAGTACPVCHKELAPGSLYCKGCGAKIGLQVTGPAATLAPSVCPRCQAAIVPGIRFCGKCGQPLS